MTLLFSIVQAVACAEAGSQLISPFVGRILDWYKLKTGDDFVGADDRSEVGYRNLQLLQKIWLQDGSDGGKLPNTGEIKELVGCDLLTISPNLLQEMKEDHSVLSLKLSEAKARNPIFPKLRSTKALSAFK